MNIELGIKRPISPREMEALRLTVLGKTQKETASAMGISVKTVAAYRLKLRDKLHLASGRSLTVFALKHEIVKLEELPDQALIA